MSSSRTADGKARQRARNKAAGSVTRSGSSGLLERIRSVRKVTWAEIEGEVEPLVDMLFQVSSVQLLAGNAGAQMSVLVTNDWREEAMLAHAASGEGKVFARLYWSPDRSGEDDGDGG